MNYWTALSIDFANQRNYLDELFKVYPVVPGLVRDLSKDVCADIEDAYNKHEKVRLLRLLLGLRLFPLKDSYVAYLKRDPTAIERNPETVNRLYGRLRELGLDDIFKLSTAAKETNRQIGPLFNNWLKRQTLGVPLLSTDAFLSSTDNAVLAGSDQQLRAFARKYLHYNGDKGLDLICRFNQTYVVGEAKFLTDFGGHQNAQFEDAKNLLRNTSVQAVKVAILDGVLYINRGNNKLRRYLTDHKEQYNIMSSLVLREFLYQL